MGTLSCPILDQTPSFVERPVLPDPIEPRVLELGNFQRLADHGAAVDEKYQ